MTITLDSNERENKILFLTNERFVIKSVFESLIEFLFQDYARGNKLCFWIILNFRAWLGKIWRKPKIVEVNKFRFISLEINNILNVSKNCM